MHINVLIITTEYYWYTKLAQGKATIKYDCFIDVVLSLRQQDISLSSAILRQHCRVQALFSLAQRQF